MEKYTLDLPKPYMKKDGGMMELMEDYPAFADMETAKKKQKALKQELEIRIRIMSHNNRFFLYRVIVNKKLCKK